MLFLWWLRNYTALPTWPPHPQTINGFFLVASQSYIGCHCLSHSLSSCLLYTRVFPVFNQPEMFTHICSHIYMKFASPFSRFVGNSLSLAKTSHCSTRQCSWTTFIIFTFDLGINLENKLIYANNTILYFSVHSPS